MRKFTCILALLLGAGMYSPAETIDEVYFNPSRLGRYETLRITDQLTAAGGVEAQNMDIQSAGTVTWNSENGFTIPQTHAKGNVNMQGTWTVDTLNNLGGLYGGTVQFTGTGESSINNLNNGDAGARIQANTVNDLTVTYNGAATSYGGTSVAGFLLAPNEVPVPGKSMCWVERVDDSANKRSLLGYCDTNTVTTTPTASADCSVASYKTSHKSECCPSASTSDTDCYTYTWTYLGTSGHTTNSCSSCTQQLCWQSLGGSCSYSELGSYCNYCTCDDAGWEEYENTYYVTEQSYKCAAAKNGW